MAWLRYDDGHTFLWSGVSYEARWHYIALVEHCSRARRWDGRLARCDALRASDVPDPEKAIAELAAGGWVEIEADSVIVMAIDAHIPPEGQRDENRLPRARRNQAAYRQRRCDEGKHDRHCPKGCPARTEAG